MIQLNALLQSCQTSSMEVVECLTWFYAFTDECIFISTHPPLQTKSLCWSQKTVSFMSSSQLMFTSCIQSFFIDFFLHVILYLYVHYQLDSSYEEKCRVVFLLRFVISLTILCSKSIHFSTNFVITFLFRECYSLIYVHTHTHHCPFIC